VRVDGRHDELRRQVLEDVARLTPVDDVERGDIARFVAEVCRLADPFDRHADPVHVTGSGFVIGERGIVLLRHLKIGTWLQPGGHIDPGETPWGAARREVGEETGMAVDFLGGAPELAHVSVHDVPDGHTHLDLRYLFDGTAMEPAPPADESQDVHWFSWDDAIGIAEPSLRSILEHLRQRFAV
jgi:8-oxo-dGTP pyrophosphatase MutT (NUDIX family)